MGKYEEALERARQGMPIDEVFPELKESEEDENYYDTIVRKLQVLGDDSGLTLNQIDFLDKHRPQPHWKPSEEQMRVFLKAIPVNLMPEELSVFYSLCNDLKKLM